MTALAQPQEMPDRGRYYEAALQPSNLVATSLRGGRLHQTSLGLATWSGGGAFVVRWDGDLIAESWALRCFLTNPSPLRTIYAKLAEHQSVHRCPHLELAYWEEQGIRVDNVVYPIVRMRWIEAPLLKTYLGSVLPHSPAAVYELSERWRRMLADLSRRRIAHGDLHHDNIAVTAAGDLLLLDYDDITVPGLEHLPADGGGLVTYQHPCYAQRRLRSLNADAFSGMIIYLALRMLAERPTLWNQLDIADTEGLIFDAADYAAPMTSRMLLMADQFSPEVALVARVTRQLCLSVELEAFPTLEQVLDGTATMPTSSEIPLPDYLSRPHRLVVPAVPAAAPAPLPPSSLNADLPPVTQPRSKARVILTAIIVAVGAFFVTLMITQPTGGEDVLGAILLSLLIAAGAYQIQIRARGKP